jgi:hypothetical protein
VATCTSFGACAITCSGSCRVNCYGCDVICADGHAPAECPGGGAYTCGEGDCAF